MDLPGYDAWKTRSPDDERREFPVRGCPQDPITCQWPRCECDKYECWACEDVRWLFWDDDHVIPCSECQSEVELDDLEEIEPLPVPSYWERTR